jgi:putative ABC transport system substrate-binding protein
VFQQLAEAKRVEGLIVVNDPIFVGERLHLAQAAARSAIPAIYPFREHTQAGGLMSYGPDLAERDRAVGRYVGRILGGEKPGELPVVQSAKFEFVLNMRSAKALGLAVPGSMQSLADEVIE